MNRKFVVIGVVVLMVIIAVVGTVWFIQNNYPDSQRIKDVTSLESILDTIASSSSSGVPAGNSYPQLLISLQQNGVDLSSLSGFAMKNFNNLFYYDAPTGTLTNNDYVLAVKLSNPSNSVFKNAPSGYVDSLNCNAPNYCVESIVAKKARDAQRIEDLATIQNALELYFNQMNQYPTGIASWQDLQTKMVNVGRIFPAIPDDPSASQGSHYAYATDASGTSYVVEATLEIASDAGTYNYSGALPNGMIWETPVPAGTCGTGIAYCVSL